MDEELNVYFSLSLYTQRCLLRCWGFGSLTFTCSREEDLHFRKCPNAWSVHRLSLFQYRKFNIMYAIYVKSAMIVNCSVCFRQTDLLQASDSRMIFIIHN